MKIATPIMLLIVLAVMMFPAVASAGIEYCHLGDRACQRAKLIRNCAPMNSTLTKWVCPDPYPG